MEISLIVNVGFLAESWFDLGGRRKGTWKMKRTEDRVEFISRSTKYAILPRYSSIPQSTMYPARSFSRY